MTRPILVCDDHDIFREMIADYLELKGFNVIKAANGIECLIEAAKTKPAAIILDIKMPQMDGVSVLKKLREHGVEAPVILVSAFASSLDKSQEVSLGVEQVLTKPFKLHELLHHLHLGPKPHGVA